MTLKATNIGNIIPIPGKGSLVSQDFAKWKKYEHVIE
jgi:hypothetical protein